MTVHSIAINQYIILGALRDGDKSGKSIRQTLGERGINKSGPIFYGIMAELEDAGYAEGYWIQEIIGDQLIKIRHYRLCDRGLSAWKNCKPVERKW